jgi:hypothetical protein
MKRRVGATISVVQVEACPTRGEDLFDADAELEFVHRPKSVCPIKRFFAGKTVMLKTGKLAAE